jgi:hypothetical protein
VRRRFSGTGVGPRHRQEVDHQLTEDSQDVGVGHGGTLAAGANAPPAFAPVVQHLER